MADFRPVIALLTDFGQGDGYVGIMKGVIASITPEAQIIDISHEIAPQHIASGAWVLASAYRYFPVRAVFVCVIDPGVGSTRRAIAVQAGDRFFVGPDNGLFSYVLAEQPVQAAVILSNSAYHLQQVSSTFHGRDIFAPAGAHLARGVAISALGTPLDQAALQRIAADQPIRQGTRIYGHIIHVDHFGNLITNIPLALVPELFSSSAPGMQVQAVFPAQGVTVDRRSRFFADAAEDGEPFIYEDSSGYVSIAVRNGNAARKLGAERGSRLFLQPG